jgi:hypothetical protein
MAKTIKPSHIVGERGTNAFANYCNRHTPYLIWRPETHNDFGIDGEVEITATTADGKLEATGEILKVQVKSTEQANSYIRQETAEGFSFQASRDDLEYWNRHSLAVILVIYDSRTDSLYAKKVTEEDSLLTTKSHSIRFSKTGHLLKIGGDQFVMTYSSVFKGRVNFDVQESLVVNLFRFSRLPKYIYHFETALKDKKDIFTQFEREQRPLFVLWKDEIYSFIKPEDYPGFCKFSKSAPDKVAKSTLFKDFLLNKQTELTARSLLNLYFKEYAYSRGLNFNKDKHRFYFRLPKGESSLVVRYKSRSGRLMPRTVVVSKTYPNGLSFVRHFAFETHFYLLDEELYLQIAPKYFFTSDGIAPLDNPKLVTKLTNFLTAKDFSHQILNHIHFIFTHLANGRHSIGLSEYPGAQLEVERYASLSSSFGIALDGGIIPDEGDLPDTGQVQLNLLSDED